MSKLWHDDIRLPPDDTWSWARTNDQARTILERGDVLVASLDHDLGCHDEDPHRQDAHLMRGTSEETGLSLCRWMVANGLVPPRVNIHSWNPVGADRMVKELQGRTSVSAIPFSPKPKE